MKKRQAIRNNRNGKAHIDSGERPVEPWHRAIAACGHEVANYEEIPWEQTAPEDRCGRCARLWATS